MSMAIEEGRARLNLEEVQELRAYVRRGSPVLLSASAAEAVLDTIEREMFRPLREKWLADMSRHATMALDELQTAHARVAELEAAMRVDINDANNSCAVKNCASWLNRGTVCPNCPCHEVSESARVLGIELASSQKLADAGQVTP